MVVVVDGRSHCNIFSCDHYNFGMAGNQVYGTFIYTSRARHTPVEYNVL